MKFYNPKKLFIGKIGYSTNSSFYSNSDKFKEESITIVKLHPSYYRNVFVDVLSKIVYPDFNSKDFVDWKGGCAIYKPESLPIFIDKKKKETKGVKILEHLEDKINRNSKISDTDIKNLIFYLNSGEDLTKEDTKHKEKKNIFNKNDYYTNLTDKKFKYEPALGRENEINELLVFLHQNNKGIILVGPENIGKATIVDELAYKIQDKSISNFLKIKKIFELDLIKLFLNNENIEYKILNIINDAIKNDAILFINNIHKICEKDINFFSILNQAIDRQGLKLLATTTPDKYNEYFTNNSNFEKLSIEEPNNEDLIKLINAIFNIYCKFYNIEKPDNIDEIVDALVALTQPCNRVYTKNLTNNDSYNPNLVIEIINRIFIHAKINNQLQLNNSNIIHAVNSCNKICDNIKEDFVNLYLEKKYEEEKRKKILKIGERKF